MKKNDMLILADTRQQKDSHIIKYFDKENIKWLRCGLESADYMALRYDEDKGIYKDYTTLIDTKKDLLELCGNLCHTSEHQRVVHEIELGQSLGCSNFIFLIAKNKIKTIEDVKSWSNPNTQVTGDTLLKVMATFKAHHNVRFVIVPKKMMGKKIIELLNEL